LIYINGHCLAERLINFEQHDSANRLEKFESCWREMNVASNDYWPSIPEQNFDASAAGLSGCRSR